jgi:mRNA-degrading endonuclease YafQ of YafQ-DinJ toxin-antitoxin module
VYTLIWSPRFTRHAERFFKQHPELKGKFAQILRDLEADPFQPHLRYHLLTGKLNGTQAVRLTESYRITLTTLITEKGIVLLDIGSRDQVYQQP